VRRGKSVGDLFGEPHGTRDIEATGVLNHPVQGLALDVVADDKQTTVGGLVEVQYGRNVGVLEPSSEPG